MKYMLDTNICIYCIKRNPRKVYERMRTLEIGDVGISAITYSELHFGVANSTAPEQNGQALAEFVAPLEIVEYSADIAEVYGLLRSGLKKKGKIIGPLDLLIAAHALRLDATLVSNNTREFSRIPGLKLENWTQ